MCHSVNQTYSSTRKKDKLEKQNCRAGNYAYIVNDDSHQQKSIKLSLCQIGHDLKQKGHRYRQTC